VLLIVNFLIKPFKQFIMKKAFFTSAFLLLAGVVFGQTFQKGGVLSVHHMDPVLDPDVTMNQYLDYIHNQLIPAYEKLFPGVQVYVMTGLNRENKDDHGLGFLWDSKENFNRYWNDDGSPTEECEKTMKELQPVLDKFTKLGSSNSTIGDWLIQ
jgi:hypothetical protein